MPRLADAPDRVAALRSASSVGWVTLPIGMALVAAPAQVGRVLALGGRPASLRTIGALDLALVPGLLAGRPRWPWLAARAGLNLAIAAYCVRVVCHERAKGAMVGVAAMVAATVGDSRTLRTLRTAERAGSTA